MRQGGGWCWPRFSQAISRAKPASSRPCVTGLSTTTPNESPGTLKPNNKLPVWSTCEDRRVLIHVRLVTDSGRADGPWGHQTSYRRLQFASGPGLRRSIVSSMRRRLVRMTLVGRLLITELRCRLFAASRALLESALRGSEQLRQGYAAQVPCSPVRRTDAPRRRTFERHGSLSPRATENAPRWK
jgi:hypothetical protein